MLKKKFSGFVAKFNAFCRDEDGLALTEYLILLGLLVAVTVGAVITFGENLAVAWNSWAVWITGLGTTGVAGT